MFYLEPHKPISYILVRNYTNSQYVSIVGPSLRKPNKHVAINSFVPGLHSHLQYSAGVFQVSWLLALPCLVPWIKQLHPVPRSNFGYKWYLIWPFQTDVNKCLSIIQTKKPAACVDIQQIPAPEVTPLKVCGSPGAWLVRLVLIGPRGAIKFKDSTTYAGISPASGRLGHNCQFYGEVMALSISCVRQHTQNRYWKNNLHTNLFPASPTTNQTVITRSHIWHAE